MVKYMPHSSPVEVVPDADLLVFRRFIEPTMASELADTWSTFRGAYNLTQDEHSPASVESQAAKIGNQPPDGVIRRIATMILGANIWGHDCVLNLQHVEAFQFWHADDKKLPVAIVHAHDGGAFDYVPRGADPGVYHKHTPGYEGQVLFAPKVFHTVDLELGDVLIQLAPHIVHRGRNASTDARVNMVIYRNS